LADPRRAGRTDVARAVHRRVFRLEVREEQGAERFVADLCVAASEATQASKFFNFPSFPDAYPLTNI
jgi:hypothetical protein